MDIRKVLLSTSYMLLLFQCMNSAYAALPEACFASKYDYDLYTRYGDEGAPDPAPIDWYNSTVEQMGEYDKRVEDYHYGDPKLAAVKISVKQSQAASGAKIVADASGSTTPSGKKTYTWGSSNVVSTSAEYSRAGGSPGTYSNIQLTVEDPVCGVSAGTQVTMTNK